MTIPGSWSARRSCARATARPVCEALVAGAAPARGAGGGPDGQRESVHGAVRAWAGAGAVRPGVRRERHHASVDGAVLADHDREGGAAAQDDARRVLHRARARFATIAEVQAALDAWVAEYNTERPHQSLRWPAADRAVRARRAHRSSRSRTVAAPAAVEPTRHDGAAPAGVSRWVEQSGQDLPGRVRLSRSARPSPVSRSRSWSTGGLVEILHAGVLVATHAQRLQPGPGRPGRRAADADPAHGPGTPPSG